MSIFLKTNFSSLEYSYFESWQCRHQLLTNFQRGLWKKQSVTELIRVSDYYLSSLACNCGISVRSSTLYLENILLLSLNKDARSFVHGTSTKIFKGIKLKSSKRSSKKMLELLCWKIELFFECRFSGYLFQHWLNHLKRFPLNKCVACVPVYLFYRKWCLCIQLYLLKMILII